MTMLKKALLVLTGFVLAVVVFGVAGFAYAQTQTPPDAEYPCPYCDTADDYVGRGRGMRGGGFGSGMRGTTDGEYGPMHTTMLAAFADALGLSVEELETRQAAGETMFEIAEAQGLSAEEFSTLMFETRSIALEQAVADGLLTEEQAAWMQSRWAEMQANGYGPGSGMGTGPCHGGSAGRGGGRWSGNQ
jgi:hypothetical protein